MKITKLTTLASLAMTLALWGCNGGGAGGTSSAKAGTTTAPSTSASTTTPGTTTPGTTTPGTTTPGTTTPGTTTPGTTTPGTTTPGTTTPPGTVPKQTPGKQTIDSSSPTNAHMVYALALINKSRAQYGLNPVVLDTVNGACALRHAQDVWACANGTIQMFSPCSHKTFNSGDRCNNVAENQGVSTQDNDPGFLAIHTQMMNEGPPPAGTINHFWVITNPNYKSVAIGEYSDAKGLLWVSEEWK